MFPITITIHSNEQLAAVQAALSGSTETPTPPKATRAAKAVAAANAAAATQSAAAPAAQTAAPAATGVTVQELAALVTELAKTKREDVVRILGEFGVPKATALKPEQYQAAFDKLTALKNDTTSAAGADSLV